MKPFVQHADVLSNFESLHGDVQNGREISWLLKPESIFIFFLSILSSNFYLFFPFSLSILYQSVSLGQAASSHAQGE